MELPLSEAADFGRPIDVTQNASPGTLLHQPPVGRRDRVRLVVTNRTGAAIQVTAEIGGTAAGDQIQFTVAANDGEELPELLMPAVTEGDAPPELRMFASDAQGCSVTGRVNRD